MVFYLSHLITFDGSSLSCLYQDTGTMLTPPVT